MFEKEAEEYVCKRNPLVTKKWFIDAFKKYNKGEKVKYLKDCEIAEYEAYIAGAEFGYNKANEWHKADVPTTPINKIVLGYIKDYNSKKFCLVKWNGEWWYDARTWNDKVKLIAWKEIVLPKESE